MKIIKKENVFKGYYKLNRLQVKSDLTGKIIDIEQFETPNSVSVLIYNPIINKIALVRQFRIGAENELTEVVAGKVDGTDNDPIKTAKREVVEETGYAVDTIQLIHEFYTTPGPVTEKMQLFYAEVSEQITVGGGLNNENEEIKIIHIAPEDFLNEQFFDAKTIITQQYWQLHKKKHID